MELMATPPVLVMVTGTIGMGQYGGGVEGNSAVEGAIRKLTVLATVVVGEAAVVGTVDGGTYRGALVVAGDAVVATVTVVETGATVVVGLVA